MHATKGLVMQSLLFSITVFFFAFAIAFQDPYTDSSLESFDEPIGQEDTNLLAEVSSLDLSVADECSGQNTPNARVRARNTEPRVCRTSREPKHKWYPNPFKSAEQLRNYVTRTNIGGRNEYCASITRGIFSVAVCESGEPNDRDLDELVWVNYRFYHLRNGRLGKKSCLNYATELESLK